MFLSLRPLPSNFWADYGVPDAKVDQNDQILFAVVYVTFFSLSDRDQKAGILSTSGHSHFLLFWLFRPFFLGFLGIQDVAYPEFDPKCLDLVSQVGTKIVFSS